MFQGLNKLYLKSHHIGCFETKSNLKFFKFLGFNATISKLEVGNILVIYKMKTACQTYMKTKKIVEIGAIMA